MRAGLETWRLGLNADMFGQFLNCNFLYADRDLDGYLSLAEWTQLFKLMSEVRSWSHFATFIPTLTLPRSRHRLPALPRLHARSRGSADAGVATGEQEVRALRRGR